MHRVHKGSGMGSGELAQDSKISQLYTYLSQEPADSIVLKKIIGSTARRRICPKRSIIPKQSSHLNTARAATENAPQTKVGTALK